MKKYWSPEKSTDVKTAEKKAGINFTFVFGMSMYKAVKNRNILREGITCKRYGEIS